MIHWNADPDLINAGPLRIRWYGLMFLIGFGIGYFIMRWICRRENKNFVVFEGLLIYLIAGTTIGARLGHVLFYAPGYYFSNPIEIFKIWEGGLASHGGTLGVIIAIILFCRRHKEFGLMWTLDRIAVPTPMVAGFIRIGNLMNSEIIGRPTDVPWAFVFERVDKVPRHPGQLYESIAYFCLFVINMILYKRNPKRGAGLYLGITLGGIFLARIFLEHFKENQEAFEAGMILNMGQILSIPFVLFAIFLIVRALKNGPPAEETAGADAKAPAAKKRRPKKR